MYFKIYSRVCINKCLNHITMDKSTQSGVRNDKIYWNEKLSLLRKNHTIL